MKFYENIRKLEWSAIASGGVSLSHALRPLDRKKCGFELQTCPYVPEDDKHVLVEIEIADELLPRATELRLCDTHGRHFHVTKRVVDQAQVRCLSEQEIVALAIEEINLPMLPSVSCVRDFIAVCPKPERCKRFGPWLTKAFEDWEAQNSAGE